MKLLPPIRKLAPTLGVAALGLTFLFAPTAMAAEGNVLPYLDPAQSTAALNIYKQKTPALTTPNDGTNQGGVTNTAIAGVVFNVFEVTNGVNGAAIDLTTLDGWIAATPTDGEGHVTPTNDWATLAGLGFIKTPTPVATCITGSDGLCVTTSGLPMTALPFGLYYVVEDDTVTTTTTPPGAVGGEPFLVTLPASTFDGLSWITDIDGNYAVWVYPKNDLISVTKSVVSSSNASAGTTSVTAGGNLTYTIVGQLPMDLSSPAGAVSQITQYNISDDVDYRLTVTAVTASLVTVDSSGATTPVASGDLASGDYAANYPATSSLNPTHVNVTFNGGGLSKLTTAAQTNYNNGSDAPQIEVQVVIETSVNNQLMTTTAKPGDISNTALVFPDDSGLPNTTHSVSSNEVTSYYGGIAIQKMNARTGIGLNGAQFQIYTGDPSQPQAQLSPLTALTMGGTSASTFTTATGQDASSDVGIAAILGLAYDATPWPDATATLATWAPPQTGVTQGSQVIGGTAANTVVYDNSGSGRCAITDDGGTTWRPGTSYWVVETVAPQGYTKLPDPIQVCLVGDLDASNNATGLTYDDWQVYNVPVNAGFDFPFTGWLANNMFATVGLLIIAGAGLVYVVRSRKANATA